jgi:signal transduction histidine kinase
MGHRLQTETRKAMKMHWPSLFLRADPKRAVLESLVLGIVSWIALLLLQKYLPSFIWRISISMCIGIGCVLLCALRLKLPEGEKRQQGLFEVTTGGALSLLLASMELVVTMVLLQGAAINELWQGPNRPLLSAAMALMLDFAMFLLFRMGVQLWLFWNQLRRRQLVWTLTYAHVLVMLLLTGLLLVILETLLIARFSDVFLVVSTTLGLLVLSAITLIAIIPPSILFSYLVMRRTTQRVKTLAAATSALRGGNYGIRIPVVGEDEVAQLQADFNAMATDLERSIRELQEERDRVAALLQARRELIATVSHELRTPVATLRSYLETTLMHWDERSTPIMQRDLQVMEDEVIHLQLLVDDLFTLARAEVGKLELRCESTDVGQLVRRIVETSAPLVWQSSRIEMVADTPSEILDVLVDPNRLEQVLRNLLHNAIRHTSPGGIVAVQVLVDPEVVLILVKDTGEGIAPVELLHIWERFYQVDSAHTRKDNGAGLGLALVKEWVEQMGGRVSVESIVGVGSCFTLCLPRAGACSDGTDPYRQRSEDQETALEFSDHSG